MEICLLFHRLKATVLFNVTLIGVRANIHLGGQTEFCPNGFSGGGGSSRNFPGSKFSGGGVVAEIFRIHILWGGSRIFPLTAVTDPEFGFFFGNCSNRP